MKRFARGTGASGAIAGVMGGFLIKFPRAKIITLAWIIFFVTTLEIPAPLLLIIWFAGQFFSGIGSLGENDYTGGGTAYFAHIGGFLAGMLLIRLFPPRRCKRLAASARESLPRGRVPDSVRRWRHLCAADPA